MFDIFATGSAPLNHELERRSVYSQVEPCSPLSLGKQTLDYVRDVFELLLQSASVAEKVRLTLNKRPNFTVRLAMQVLSQRGSSDLAISKLQEICETH